MTSYISNNSQKIFAKKSSGDRLAENWTPETATNIAGQRTFVAKQSILAEACQAILTQANTRTTTSEVLLQ